MEFIKSSSLNNQTVKRAFKDKALRGFFRRNTRRAFFLLSGWLFLAGCQTVTVSNKGAHFKNQKYRAARAGVYKRYSDFSRRFVASASIKNPAPAAKESLVIRPSSSPHKTLTYNFYLLGLAPRRRIVHLSEVCDGETVSLIKTGVSLQDFLVSAITFGIVSPRTAKIWC